MTNPITTMDPELRNRLHALKECTADMAATQEDVVRYTDQLLACFDQIEEQRARELQPRCSVASVATHGAFYCTRDRGHDGPCAAHPIDKATEETGLAALRLDDRVTALEQYLQQNNGVQPWRPPVLKPLDLPTGIKGAINDVFSFHDAMDLPVVDKPEWVDHRAKLRLDLCAEEFCEMLEACGLNDQAGLVRSVLASARPQRFGGIREQLAALADSWCDQIYVIVGWALEFGIPLDRVWRAVQKANMAKRGGPVREDGKRLKPEGWQPPNIIDAVFADDPDELALASAEGRTADPG